MEFYRNNHRETKIVATVILLTKITFMPDEQIFTETREFKFDLMAKRLRNWL